MLGQLFPQTTIGTNTEEIQKKQEELEKETNEKTQEHKKQWQRMKLGYLLFSPALLFFRACEIIRMRYIQGSMSLIQRFLKVLAM